jgi:hypothetical protein
VLAMLLEFAWLGFEQLSEGRRWESGSRA